MRLFGLISSDGHVNKGIITFLTFVYSILIEPTITKEDKQSVLESLKGKVIENVSGELIVASITASNNINNCLRFGNLIGELGVGSRIIIKDELENNQQIYVLGNDLEISRDIIGRGSRSDRYLKLVEETCLKQLKV